MKHNDMGKLNGMCNDLLLLQLKFDYQKSLKVKQTNDLIIREREQKESYKLVSCLPPLSCGSVLLYAIVMHLITVVVPLKVGCATPGSGRWRSLR